MGRLCGKSDRLAAQGGLTGDEVCNRLRISQRTLQKLRDKGFIGYSQIGHKFFYKPEEVKRLIPLVGIIHPGGK